jgi:hypothetical protein
MDGFKLAPDPLNLYLRHHSSVSSAAVRNGRLWICPILIVATEARGLAKDVLDPHELGHGCF